MSPSLVTYLLQVTPIEDLAFLARRKETWQRRRWHRQPAQGRRNVLLLLLLLLLPGTAASDAWRRLRHMGVGIAIFFGRALV
jgi:hypothetical protein